MNTASTGNSTNSITSNNSLIWIVLLLAALTGLIHVYVGATESRPLLLIAGLGFVPLIGALWKGWFIPQLYLATAGYTAIQIIGWLARYSILLDEAPTVVGILDKAVQLPLVVILVYLFFREGRSQ